MNSEKDDKIKYLTKKIQLLQKENKLFQIQLINFQKTFGDQVAPNLQLKNNDVVYFLHIPKTAGTTLINILDNYFEPDTVLKSHDWKQLLPFGPMNFSKYRFIRGHFGYSIVRYIPKKPKIITMLRNPSDTILSTVRMIRRQPKNAERYSMEKYKTLSEIIVNCKVPLLKNPQMRWLLMDQDIYAIIKENSTILRDIYRPEEDEKMLPYVSQDQYLNMVRRRLLEFAFVGIVERMEDSLFLLHYTFGWKPIRNFMRENASRVDDRIEDLTDSALEKISQLSDKDQVIYKFGQELFEEKYSKMVKDLKEKYYEPKFKNMESNDAIFEMLKLHHDQQIKNSVS